MLDARIHQFVNRSNTCVNTPDTGATCDDGDECTPTDTCNAAGTCDGEGQSCDCNAADECTPPTGQHRDCVMIACEGSPKECVFTAINDGGSCASPDSCMAGGVCNAAGACQGLATTCDDGIDCTVDSCNSGVCANPAADVGTNCSDDN
ncbi:MAG: hypothetical protein ACI9MR_005047, partial [Myxococcota bacterium]